MAGCGGDHGSVVYVIVYHVPIQHLYISVRIFVKVNTLSSCY